VAWDADGQMNAWYMTAAFITTCDVAQQGTLIRNKTPNRSAQLFIGNQLPPELLFSSTSFTFAGPPALCSPQLQPRGQCVHVEAEHPAADKLHMPKAIAVPNAAK
jgi:hypothetical protein